MKIKRLLTSTPQGFSGRLLRESQYVFNYDGAADKSVEISLGMPVRAQSYASNALHPIFAMNRPEGWLSMELSRRLAKTGHVDDMRLLSIIGAKQIGRVRLHEEGVEAAPSKPQVKLSEILESRASAELFEMLADTYLESGISGVQPKVMVPDASKVIHAKATLTQPDLIVKSGGVEYPSLAQNEFLCMEAARLAKMDVPDFWLSHDGQLFVMERFDLTREADGGDRSQLGFEDMATLMGKNADALGNYKYEGSYENIAKAIRIYCGEENIATSMAQFFYSVVLSIMVRNGDAHLKNYGLLYTDPSDRGAVRLSPTYDIVTTTVYGHENPRTGVLSVDRTLALKFGKSKSYPSREQIMDFGSRVCGVARPDTVLDEIAEAMGASLREHQGRVDREFFSKISREWDAGRMSAQPVLVFGAGADSGLGGLGPGL